MVQSCCVKNCPSIQTEKMKSSISFHRFPVSQPKMMKKWLEFLNYGPDWVPLKYSTICSNHFKPTDYRDHTKIKTLKLNVYPSLLGKDELEEMKKLKKINDKSENKDGSKIYPTKNEGKSGFCRLCGEEYFSKLKNIFQIGSNCDQKIDYYLHLKVSSSDELPVSICEKCELNLKCIEEFVNNVKKVQEILFEKLLLNKNICIALPNTSLTKLNTPFNSSIILPNNHLKQSINTEDEVILDPLENNWKNLKADVQMKTDLAFNQNRAIVTDKYRLHQQLIVNNHQSNEIFKERSTHLSKPSDNMGLITKIKQEIITTNVENNNMNIQQRNPSKKIEILEDIKLAPSLNKIAYKSFKSIYDESMLNKNNKSICHTVPASANILNLKVVDSKKLCIPNNGKGVVYCQLCYTYFVSKYALNHHKKHLCKYRPNILKEKVFVKKKIVKKKLSKEKNIVDNSIVHSNKKEEPVAIKLFKSRRKSELNIKKEYDFI